MRFFADACGTTTASTGSPFTLSTTPLQGHRTPQSAGMAVGNEVFMRIAEVDSQGKENGKWELSLWTYSSSNVITRKRFVASSTGAKIDDFAAGNKRCYVMFAAADAYRALSEYQRPAPEATRPAETSVSALTVDFTRAIVSDAMGSSLNWAGNGVESVVQSTSGRQFFRYTQGGSTDEKLIYSEAGGGTNTSTWTVLDTQAGSLNYNILLRDRGLDGQGEAILYFSGVGSSGDWTLNCKAFDPKSDNTAPTQLGSTYQLPQYYGFLEGISTNPYIRGGIGADGLFCLVQPLQQQPGSSASRATETLEQLRIVLTGKFNRGTNSFEFDEPFIQYTNERWAYDIIFVGVNGDPDEIMGVCGRDVRIDEDRDFVTGLNGTVLSGRYNFDAIGGWVFNRRTRDNIPITYLTSRQRNLSYPCIFRGTYTNGASATLTIDSIEQGSLRAGMKVTSIDRNATGIPAGCYIQQGAVWTGTPGAIGSTVPLVTTATGSTAATTTAAGTNVRLQAVDEANQVAAIQKRFFGAILLADGKVLIPYVQVRHVQTVTGFISAATSPVSLRMLKVTTKLDRVYDRELFSEATNKGNNYHTVCQLGNGAIYLVHNVPGASSQELNLCKFLENQTWTGSVTTNGSPSQTVTVNSNTTGHPYVGMIVKSTALSAPSRILTWGTYNPATGTGTIVLESVPTSGVTATFTGYARACCEGINSNTSLSTAWGTRASGFIPFIPDDRSGSVQDYNAINMFVPTKSAGYSPGPAASSETTEVVTHMHVRVP
jgi:hypothetical protein